MKGMGNLLWILIIGAIGLGVYFGGSYGGLWAIQAQPIFCNDFEYIGCAEDLLNPTQKINIGIEELYWCPPSATRCEITPNVANTAICQNQPTKGFWGNWLCRQIVQICTPGSTCEMLPGQWASTEGLGSFSAKRFDQRLFWCGKSSCAAQMAGVPVRGASGCNFVPTTIGTEQRVYDDNNKLIDPDYQGIYTVPKGRSYQYTSFNLRRPCGSTGETCEKNSDCAALYPYSISYGGDTYGVGFQSGQMIFYGCKKSPSSVATEKDVMADGTEMVLQYNEFSICDAVSLIGVECIPDSDTCGPNAACKQTSATTFECVPYEQVECTYDWNCGIATTCSRENNEYKLVKPTCENNKCKQSPIRIVQCCYDMDCPDDYYCDSDFVCKEDVKEKTECPYECCLDESDYRDKPCVGNDFCCPDNSCAISEEYCFGGGDGDDDLFNSIWIIIFTALFGALGYWKKEWLGAVIGGIGGLIIGIMVFTFLSMAWWQQGIIFLIFGGAAVLVGYVAVLAIPLIIAVIIALR